MQLLESRGLERFRDTLFATVMPPYVRRAAQPGGAFGS